MIRIAENTINEGARRFTIAHELGDHLLKHPANGSDGACASVRAEGPPNTGERDYEAEANAFASELLLPRHLVAPKCEGEPSLEIPRSIAFEFLMSVPASSIRYDAMSRLMLTVLAAVAEFERDLIRERTHLGLQRARANGVQLGRPKADGPTASAVRRLRNTLECTVAMARRRAEEARA